jgi:predicted peroxiredoxin
MAGYLLIESRDPFESNDVPQYFDLAKALVRDGHAVTLFLLQNGVLPARPSLKSNLVADAVKAGVEVLADDFSLRERGIDATRLAGGAKAAPLETVVDQLAAGRKAMWH